MSLFRQQRIAPLGGLDLARFPGLVDDLEIFSSGQPDAPVHPEGHENTEHDQCDQSDHERKEPRAVGMNERTHQQGSGYLPASVVGFPPTSFAFLSCSILSCFMSSLSASLSRSILAIFRS